MAFCLLRSPSDTLMPHDSPSVCILSHRGLWCSPIEKNTAAAFLRSFSLGFGVETDIRDIGGTLVVSHDPPGHDALTLRAFFELYEKYGAGLPLALNVKADGLQILLAELVAAYSVQNYFCFDMSVPDTRGYVARGLPCFARQSEYEPEPVFYDRVAGVWMDGFERDWVEERHVARHLGAGKRVCLVSPELHGRDHLPFWGAMRAWRLAAPPAPLDRALARDSLSSAPPRDDSATLRDPVLLCTDRPVEAKECFHA